MDLVGKEGELRANDSLILRNSQVTGVMDAPKEGDATEKSNHDIVMARFSDLGYEVRCRKVCPSSVGVPMTRNRVHYVGLLRTKVARPAQQMDNMARAWDAISQVAYTSLPLSHFLLQPDSKYLKIRAEGFKSSAGSDLVAGLDSYDHEVAGTKNGDRAWRVLHAKTFRDHQAQDPNHSRASKA